MKGESRLGLQTKADREGEKALASHNKPQTECQGFRVMGFDLAEEFNRSLDTQSAVCSRIVKALSALSIGDLSSKMETGFLRVLGYFALDFEHSRLSAFADNDDSEQSDGITVKKNLHF